MQTKGIVQEMHLTRKDVMAYGFGWDIFWGEDQEAHLCVCVCALLLSLILSYANTHTQTQRGLILQNTRCMQYVFYIIIYSSLKFFLCVFLQETEIASDCNHVSIPSIFIFI